MIAKTSSLVGMPQCIPCQFYVKKQIGHSCLLFLHVHSLLDVLFKLQWSVLDLKKRGGAAKTTQRLAGFCFLCLSNLRPTQRPFFSDADNPTAAEALPVAIVRLAD